MKRGPGHRRRRPRVLRVLLLLWLLLLAASHLVQSQAPDPNLGRRLVTQVSAVDGEGRRLDHQVQMTWLEWGREHRHQRLPVVLLHGSPGSAGNFDQLAPLLAEERFVIAPDLPGFGPLAESYPSLSLPAHAEYVDQLLVALDIGSAHVVGFSLGGAVAIHLADPGDAARRTNVASMTLLAATGVQELELFGNYHVNHAVHGLQLVGLRLIDSLFPHFGALDDAMLSVDYARNFFDSDQRPIRSILEQIEIPSLILHGSEDRLVPVAAAYEHHRLLPQSVLDVTEFGHLMVFRHPQRVASSLQPFFSEVDAGTAKHRADATLAARQRALEPYSPTPQPATGLALFTLFLLIAAATWVSEDLATISAGLLVGDERIGFLWAVGAAVVGIVSGDFTIYASGRWLGQRALARPPLRWILPPARVVRARQLFERQGQWLIFASRFTPGTRVATYFAAGLVRAGALRIAVYMLLAAVLWVPAVVALAAWIGDPVFDLMRRFESGGWVLALLALIGVWVLVHNLPLLLSANGRALLRARWGRRLRWEFLPSWVIYLPLLPWLAWLAIRHRGLTFTAANPGMVDGGVVGESKSRELDRLPAGAVADYLVLRPQDDLEIARQQAQQFFRHSGPPVVLKPDVGERGRGVIVARTPDEVDEYLNRRAETTICQRFVGGKEYGVFWVDRPDEELGLAWSVAAKLLPRVSGDGRHTVRQLILRHPRERFHADRYLATRTDLDEVPESGEVVRLGDLGTHCRGATFVDARDLATPQLAKEITRISRHAGFGFGRYDLRVAGADDLAAGRNLTILEFNGVSSEAVHIYDPNASFANALRTLAAQWRLAYEVGAHNATQDGVPVMGLWQFVRRSMRRLAERG